MKIARNHNLNAFLSVQGVTQGGVNSIYYDEAVYFRRSAVGSINSTVDQEEWMQGDISASYSNSLGGQQNFTTPGTTSWSIPGAVNVSYMCFLLVGAGGSGMGTSSYAPGAGGGSLVWVNNVPMTDDGTLEITVASEAPKTSGIPTPYGGYQVNHFSRITGTWGGQSVFWQAGGAPNPRRTNSANDTYAQGGNASLPSIGSNATLNTAGVTQAGYSGGRGGYGYAYAGGGGGAAGYSGAGGRGGGQTQNQYYGAGLSGSGGGGGGGGACGSFDAGGNGGGVGIFGEGSSGSGGAGGSGNAANGYGGSGGEDGGRGGGLYQGSSTYINKGGDYGGGGASADNTYGEHGSGAQGVVRIIWGAGRGYPATLTGDI